MRWVFVAAASGFALLLTAASILTRDQIFQSFLDPGVPFQTYQRPPAPDYALDDAWVARPAPEAPGPGPAVFFVHPTTYDGGAHWNAPFDRIQETDELRTVVLPNYAAPFLVEGADLYAPHYRQAALYAFMNNREDSVQARLLAYEDVRAAFARFINDIGPDRSFVVAGIGQGALNALGLLIQDVAPDNTLRPRLATAYLLEAPIPLDLFAGPLADLPPCATAEDVRCVVAFAAARPNERHRIDALTARSMSWTPQMRLSFVADRSLLCVNPLLWTTTEDFAPARLHQGGAAAEGLALDDAPSPMPNQTGAQCQSGVLMIDRPDARVLRRPGRLGEDRRVRPANLFYMDLRLDAERRMAAFADLRAEEAAYVPPLDAPVEVDDAPVVPIDG